MVGTQHESDEDEHVSGGSAAPCQARVRVQSRERSGARGPGRAQGGGPTCRAARRGPAAAAPPAARGLRARQARGRSPPLGCSTPHCPLAAASYPEARTPGSGPRDCRAPPRGGLRCGIRKGTVWCGDPRPGTPWPLLVWRWGASCLLSSPPGANVSAPKSSSSTPSLSVRWLLTPAPTWLAWSR